MKKVLLTLFLSAIFGMTMAQNDAGNAKADAPVSTKYVTASDLNALITSISNRLISVEEQLGLESATSEAKGKVAAPTKYVSANDLIALFTSISNRLASIEKKLGIDTQTTDNQK